MSTPMLDDKDMAMDPVLEEVCKMFGGLIDPRQLQGAVAKMSPDPSEVHVRTAPKKKEEKQSWARNVGLATNAAGAVAGPAAIWSVTRGRKGGGIPRDVARSIAGPGKHQKRSKMQGRLKRAAEYLDNPKSKKARIAAGMAGAGAIGLQIANWAGDAIAANELRPKKNKVEKGFFKPKLLVDNSSAIPAARKKVLAGTAIGSAGVAGAVGYSKGKNSGLKQGSLRPLTPPAVAKPIAAAKPVAESVARAKVRMPNEPEKVAKRRGRLARYVADIADQSSQVSAKNLQTAGDEVVDRAAQRAKKLIGLGSVGLAGAATAPVATNYGLKVLSERKKKPVKKAADLIWTGEISKVDDEKRQVFGWCSITSIDGEPVVDLQGDYVPLDEIEKAAYTYVVESRKGGDMHARDGENPMHVANMVESFVVTPEKLQAMGLDENALPHGWWVGFKVDDDTTWQRVKTKERTGFSIHGKGSRVEKMLEAS